MGSHIFVCRTFVHLPCGQPCPSGWYSSGRHAWTPSDQHTSEMCSPSRIFCSNR